MAIYYLGLVYHTGQLGLEKAAARAVELYERAAELGVKEAHFKLGCLYDKGTDVEKDTARAIRYFEAAAMRGQAHARFNLGRVEYNARNYDLALQHWMIAAKLGDQVALNNIKDLFLKGLATKTDYAEALRGYQRAIGEMRSDNRDEIKRLLN